LHSPAIGDDNLIMAYAHIAHDANIGSHCILGNAVTHRRPRDHRRLGDR
jgi:acyl-[acyl carrier protein]--UDP-N-acetylglucosamine O-acyltransferase